MKIIRKVNFNSLLLGRYCWFSDKGICLLIGFENFERKKTSQPKRRVLKRTRRNKKAQQEVVQQKTQKQLKQQNQQEPQKQQEQTQQQQKKQDPFKGETVVIVQRAIQKIQRQIQFYKSRTQICCSQHNDIPRISYQQFLTHLKNDEITFINIKRVSTDQGDYFNAEMTTNKQKYILQLGNPDIFLQNLQHLQEQLGKDKSNFIPVKISHSLDLYKSVQKFGSIFHLIFLGFFIYYIFSFQKRMGKGKGGGADIFSMGSKVKQYGLDTNVKTRFPDVAGLDQAKSEVVEFVDFLKKPKKYKDLGARIPKGALLSGPPGTGKTMLAKACAGQAGVPFFYISGSDFVQMFVGVGASRVRQLFRQAKKKSPSIIFIDQIDAVGRKRESNFGGNDQRDNTLNQLLVQMDGFGTDHNVIVLAATNRKQLLDKALTRAGRFDRQVDITHPDIQGRKQIFNVHLQPLKIDPQTTIDQFAKRLSTLTPGFSGADIANLCNEAAILAARLGKPHVQRIDFEMATQRVIGGVQKKKLVNNQQRKTVSYHESGHAVTAWFLQGAHPLLKLTIIPRSKGSLGFAQYLPTQSSLQTKQQLLDRICFILGGRCSEQHFFGKITTGAYDDLKKAYQIAHTLVTKLGMSQKIGYIGFEQNQYMKTYSEQTSKIIDQEIKRIIDQCAVRTRALVKKHADDIDRLATRLLQKESLNGKEIVQILGQRPFPPKSNYKAYLQFSNKQTNQQKQQSKQNKQVQNKGEQQTEPKQPTESNESNKK